jgi:cell division protein FtsZ
MDLSGAKGVLVLITATKSSLKLKETQLAMNTIRAFASPDAHVIFGTAYDEALGEQMRVTVVGTGLTGKSAARPAAPEPKASSHVNHKADHLFHIPAIDPAVHSANPAPAGAPEQVARPAVWRPTRNPTAPTSRTENGAEDYEVPAYLRKRVE